MRDFRKNEDDYFQYNLRCKGHSRVPKTARFLA